MDQEQEALAKYPDGSGGIGNNSAYPGWYGGKVHFRGSIAEKNGSYMVKLDQCVLGASCKITRRFGSERSLRIKIPPAVFYKPDNKLIEFFSAPFVIWECVYRAYSAKDLTVYLYRTNEVYMDGEIYVTSSSGMSAYDKSLYEFIMWANPLEFNQGQVSL